MSAPEITAVDKARIAEAIRAAEQRTSGEIICVLAHRSSDYSHVSALWAAGLALISPWPLLALTEFSAQRIFLCQFAIFVAATLVFSWRPLRMRLVPRPVKRLRAHRAAMEQFYARGTTRTPARSGIMIFVSLAERYARIIADEGIAVKVSGDEWRAAIDALIAHMRKGDMAAGFEAAIAICGEVLAAHAPPDGSGGHLPDRIYVI